MNANDPDIDSWRRFSASAEHVLSPIFAWRHDKLAMTDRRLDVLPLRVHAPHEVIERKSVVDAVAALCR